LRRSRETGVDVRVRRVVTGTSVEGKSLFVSDDLVDGIATVFGNEFHRLWGSDHPVKLPSTGDLPPSVAFFPPTSGFRFGLFTVPPDAALPDDLDLEAALVEMEAALPGMAAHMEVDNPGMHATDTVDFEYVLSGHVRLELDDGATVELGPGDTVVQNGTRHAWRNPYDEPCQMVVVLVGAPRA
jgi:mannose-6-phosphate isomerase-like protein (cupin superfamily)